MKVCLLGCYGFLGSHILRHLVDEGHAVTGIDRLAFIPEWRKHIIPAGFQSATAELIDHSAVIETHLNNSDVIIFAAGNPAPASTSFDLLFGEEFRVLVNILECLAKHNRKARLVFISSGGTVYGRRERGSLCREHEALHPISMYGVLKAACENAIGAYMAQYGLQATILRVANPYGTGQNPDARQGFIPVVLKKLILNEEIRLFGDGNARRDFIYIDDLMRFISCVLKTATSETVFNVGSGKGVSMNAVIRQAAEIAGGKPKIRRLDNRPQDLDWNALSVEKAERCFGWRPSVSLEDGLRSTYRWLEKIL